MQPTIPYSTPQTGYGQNPYGANPIDSSIFAPEQQSSGNDINFYRKLIQSGQMSPTDAYNNVFGDYVNAIKNSSASEHGYAITQAATDQLKGQLFQPMNIKNTMGRTGLLNNDGSVMLQGEQINKTTTNGAGNAFNSNFTPVAPYDPTKDGSAPGMKITGAPAVTMPTIPRY